MVTVGANLGSDCNCFETCDAALGMENAGSEFKRRSSSEIRDVTEGAGCCDGACAL